MKNQEIEWLLKEKYQGEKGVAFFADCERLASGEPLAYVIGSIPFLDCTIRLDSKPLIPRPETEFWVEQAIGSIRERLAQGSPRQSLGEPWADVRILDLCAGSGAIGVAVAKAIPAAEVTFGEIDATHLPTIEKNLIENRFPKLSIDRRFWSEQYNLIASDLFENIPKEEKFDFILTNPPYIDAAADTVDASVTANEPHLALFGGNDGMEVIERIIDEARALLAPHGQLWLEHEPLQTEAIAALATTHDLMAVTHPDQYGTLRYSVLSIAVAK